VADSRHVIVPQAGTVYGWHSMPSDGQTSSDFPLSAFCACGQPIVRKTWRDEWAHRDPDAPLPEEPAEPTW
jgi:hypothetical protein